MNRPTFAQRLSFTKRQESRDNESEDYHDHKTGLSSQQPPYASKERLDRECYPQHTDLHFSKGSKQNSVIADCLSDSKPQVATTARTAPLPTYYQSPTGNIYPRPPLLPPSHPGMPQQTFNSAPAAQVTQMKSKHCAAAFADDADVFPALDFRKCTRCSKNDALSPGFCVYMTTCADTDSAGMVVLRQRERVVPTHAYPSKQDSPDEENNNNGDFVCIKKERQGGPAPLTKECGSQTVIGVAEVRTMKKGKLAEYKQVDPVFVGPAEFR